MPAKGSKLKHGNRDYIFDKEFFNNLSKEHPNLNLSYADCSRVIRNANKLVALAIENEEDGFKLPNGLGYFCAVKFKPTNPMIDWPNTKKIFPRDKPGNEGKFVYFANLDTDGYSPKIGWYRVGRVSNSTLNETWKFKAMTPLSKAVSNMFKKGKLYQEYTITDFIRKGSLENMYNKKYRKELKD